VSKLKVKFKNSQITVKSKLSKDEQINAREVEILNSKIIRGIMKPTVEGEKKLSYLSPGGIKLEAYLKKGITKNDFFLVIAQILEAVKSIGRNSFNINNLILNMKYVFVNEMTHELHFVYQPIYSSAISSDLAPFLYDVAYSVTLALNEDYKCVNNFIAYLKGLQAVSVINIEKYLLDVYPQIYKQVKRQKYGQSEYLGSFKNGKDIYYDMDKRRKPTPLVDYDSTSLLSEKNDKDEVTSLLIEDVKDTPTSLLDDDNNEPTSLLVEDEDEATSLLIDDEPTSLLSEGPQITYPYLIRKNSFDRMDINKPVFRIGKERSYVDYFVANNNAVSRIHADIITKNKSFFVKDENSTNGTYVNGNRLSPNEEVQVFDGDIITFANEEFEFHI
jgi:hypothetical protein